MAVASESKSEGDTFWNLMKKIERLSPSGHKLDLKLKTRVTQSWIFPSLLRGQRNVECKHKPPMEVLSFTVATGPTSGIAEDGTSIALLYLMFPEELIEHIVVKPNRYAQECYNCNCYNSGPRMVQNNAHRNESTHQSSCAVLHQLPFTESKISSLASLLFKKQCQEITSTNCQSKYI